MFRLSLVNKDEVFANAKYTYVTVHINHNSNFEMRQLFFLEAT